MLTPVSIMSTPSGHPIPAPPPAHVPRFSTSVYGDRHQSMLGQQSGDYHQLPTFAAHLQYSDSMGSVVFPNALTQAFSIKSFREHKDLLHKSFSMPRESLTALFPPDLIKSASHFGMSITTTGALDDQSVQGLLSNVAATVIQSVWRKYVSRVLVENIRRERAAALEQLHADNLFQYHLLTSQSAVRRYLASRRASNIRQRRASQATANKYDQYNYATQAPPQERSPHRRRRQDSHEIPIGVISADDLPPGSKFDADGNRIGGEHLDGDLAREMAATVIQRQVKKRVAERFAAARRELSKKRLSAAGIETDENGRPLGGFTRKYSAAEGVLSMARMFNKPGSPTPAPPSLQLIHRTLSRAGLNSGLTNRVRPPPSQGSGLAAVYWDAGGLLLNPRRSLQLWGLRILHDITMNRRRDEATFYPNLPLTIWVQGPLESAEEKIRRAQYRASTEQDQMFMSSPSGRAVPISRSITPRSGRRGLTGSALRRLSPLGLGPTRSPRYQAASPRPTPLSPRAHFNAA